MASPCPSLQHGSRLVVGSFGNQRDLAATSADEASAACDVVELRLDLLDDPGSCPWTHLNSLPLLFTARRAEEGGCGSLSAAKRESLLRGVLDQASLIDIELASLEGMASLPGELRERGLPWIASFHDFQCLPADESLREAAARAREAGAHVFKLAAHLQDPQDLARLARFQLADHGIVVAAMGMGPLAPVSRLLCAQAGSALNYGYLGSSPTAPGQWDAALLKQAVGRLTDWPPGGSPLSR